MNRTNKSYRGAGFTLVEIMIIIAVLGLLSAMLLPQQAKAAEFIQGTYYIDGSSNSISIGGTNLVRSVVQPDTTNTFNLSNTPLYQGNTNQWPALPLSSSFGLNHRILCLSGQLQGSAAYTGQETIRIAVSTRPDTNWITGFLSFTVTANGTSPVYWGTNIDTYAYPYACIYRMESTNAAGDVTLTNIINQPVDKTGSN